MQPQVFDRLWLEAWSHEIHGTLPMESAKLIMYLAGLRPGGAVLDLGSGVGRVAHALTRFGVTVTGVERSEEMWREATRIPNPACRFVWSDWINYKPDRPFACAIFWFTTLCAGPRQDADALRVARLALRNGGILLIETRHCDQVPRGFQPKTERRAPGCVLVEHHTFDPDTRIQTTEEHFTMGEATVTRTYDTYRYRFAELRDLCLGAGFEQVEGYDAKGQPLSERSERMVLRAQLEGLRG